MIFSSKKFSPVPYFPSNKKDMSLIVDLLDLKNNQTIIDLGAGDGIVILEAANSAFEKKLNTQFVAVDINPILIFILYLRRYFHPNKKNVKIIQGDFFDMSLRALAKQSKQKIATSPDERRSPRNDTSIVKQFNNITIYLYISPWFLDRVTKRVLQQIPQAKIVSYMYPIKSLQKRERVTRGKNSIYIYN